jgi:hypothetical protein
MPFQQLGLSLRMDHGTQYLSDHFLKQVRFWGIQPSFAFSSTVGGGEKGYQNGGEVVPCQESRSE